MADEQKQKNPLKEITQPFVDLAHAPRALWGINLAYVLEGMVYFGMLGYLAIYCSEFIFQAVDGADEAAHLMVMVLTGGITIAMFFLGMVTDKRGVRFALIAAFVVMLVGRAIWAGGPSLLGLEPVRPTVLVGDKVSLHITELDTRYGNKAITQATVIASEESNANVDETMKLDLSLGEGIAPSEALESRLVRLGQAELVEGEGQEWLVRYGTEQVTAQVLMRGAEEIKLSPGSRISLDRAYITRDKGQAEKEEEEKDTPPKPTLRAGATISLNRARIVRDKEKGDEFVIEVDWPEDVASVDTSACPAPEQEYVIRSHWVSDIAAVDTFPKKLTEGNGIAPDAELDSWNVSLSEATLGEGEMGEWQVTYGEEPVTARLVLRGDKLGTIGDVLTPDLALGEGTAPDESFTSAPVQLGRAKLVGREGEAWHVEYGSAPATATLLIHSGSEQVPLGVGALISVRRAKVIEQDGGKFALRADWPEDIAAVDTYGCVETPYRSMLTVNERDLKVKTRAPISDSAQAPPDAAETTITELRDAEDGPINAVLRDAYVTYVRNGGYFLQTSKDSPAIFVFVSPFWSPLQIVTLVGIFFVVVGYGMYQPAAYAGVRKFTTPKTAAMGFAMLYALMNLGGWLPSFAFLLRDDDYAGLGIPGTFWVYAGFTVVALVCTTFILSKRTVVRAETFAKEETARIKAEEEKNGGGKAEESKRGEDTSTAGEEEEERPRVRPHMWLLWMGAVALLLFKGKSPWYYAWSEVTEEWATSGFASAAVWHWILAGLVFISPVFLAAIPKARSWIARHPLEDPKFSYFIFALIPVQTLFTYNWLILPAYIKRAYEGWIGDYFEIAANANPILIFIAVPIIAAMTLKAKVYNMMIYGTFIMAAPAFLLILGPHWWTLFPYLLIMTIGEAMWQPRFLQYAAEIAPEGRTGEYMGVAQLPWFLTKVLVPLLYSGRMMDTFCPAEGPKNTEVMWLVFACIAMCSTVLLLLAKGWIGKDFKTKAD
jgi:MFS family permease